MCPTPRTILLADDDRLICEAIGDELRDKGYVVEVVHDGEDALRRARELRPDILILDIVMPKLNGAQLSRLIRQEPHLRHVKIVALSAVGTLDFRWFSELSADFFVAKKTLPETCRNLLVAIELVGGKGREALARRLLGTEPVTDHGLGTAIGVQPRLPGILHPLAEACGRALLELDGNAYILQATPLACDVLGRDEPALLGTAFPSLCAESDRSMMRAMIEAAATSTAPQQFAAVLTIGNRRLHVQLVAVRVGALQAIVAVLIPWDDVPAAEEQAGAARPPGEADAYIRAVSAAAGEDRASGRRMYRVRLSRPPAPGWVETFRRVVHVAAPGSILHVDQDLVTFEADHARVAEWVSHLDGWLQAANSAHAHPSPRDGRDFS